MKLFKIETFNETYYAYARYWDIVDKHFKVYSERSITEIKKRPKSAKVVMILEECWANEHFVYFGKLDDIKKQVKNLGDLRKIVGVATYYGD